MIEWVLIGQVSLANDAPLNQPLIPHDLSTASNVDASEVSLMTPPEWAQIAQGIGSIGSMVVSGVIAYALYRYTQRRDRLDFLRSRWSEQQLVNLHQLESDENLMIFERMVYGKDYVTDPASAKEFFQVFLIINQIQHHYFAMKHGIISSREFHDYAIPTLSLLHRRKSVAEYLLRHRGYSLDFKEQISHLFGETTPPQRPPQDL